MGAGVGRELTQGYERVKGILQEPSRSLTNPYGLTPGDRAIYGATEGVLPAAGGTLMELGKAGVKAVGGLTPDFIEKPAVDALQDFGNFLLETDSAQYALNLLEESFSDYQEWRGQSKENESVGRALEAALDIAAIATPATKIKPVIPDGSSLEAIGHNLTRAGRRQLLGQRKDLVQQMLAPDSLHGKGRTTVEGISGRKVYHPDATETEVIDVVSSIKNVKPRASYTQNYYAITDEIAATTKRLDNLIDGAGNPKISKEDVLAKLQRLVDEANTTDPMFVGDTKAAAGRMLTFAQKLIADSDGTALGLLNVRRDLDRFINSSKRGVFNPDYNSAATAARGIVGGTLNDAVSAAVPNVAVKGLLRKQHLMFRGADVVEEKMLKEASTVITRLMQNVSRKTGVKLPTTPLAIAATGSAAASLAASGVMPYLTGSIATAAGAYGLYKAALTPMTKKALGTLLVASGKALKAAKGNAALVEQIKVDRLVLISLLEDLRAAPDDLPEQEEEDNG